MPVERKPSCTVITGAAIGGTRAVVLLSGMKLYLQHGILPSRHITPAVMRRIATEFTGKPYPRSRKGLERAYADLEVLVSAKSLDELGETAVVNKAVGGPAADLTDV